MKKQNTIIGVLAGLALIIATVWYLVIYPGNELVGATGYLFILLSILVFFGGIGLAQLLLNKKKNFFQSNTFLILLGYFALSVIISLVFMIKPVEKKTILIIIEVILMVLVGLSMFMLLAAEHATPSTNFSSIEWNDPLRAMINKLRALKDDKENKDFAQGLAQLYQRSIFIDTSQKTEGDEDLVKRVDDLEIILVSQDYPLGEKKDVVNKALAELEELLKNREYEIRQRPWNKM